MGVMRHNTQGAMSKVIGRQRIKRARSAREDSSIYLYITVVPFSRSRARKQHSPLGVYGAKSDFLGCPDLELFLGASKGSRGAFWSPFGWFWDLFFWSQTEGLCSL